MFTRNVARVVGGVIVVVLGAAGVSGELPRPSSSGSSAKPAPAPSKLQTNSSVSILTLLEVDFTGKPIDSPIGTDGPGDGEPTRIDNDCLNAIVRGGPFPNSPWLEITQKPVSGCGGAVYFQMGNLTYPLQGTVSIDMDVVFKTYSSYHLRVNNKAQSPATTIYKFENSGDISYQNNPIGAYQVDELSHMRFVFDLNNGLFDFWINDNQLQDDVPYIIDPHTGGGIGGIYFGPGWGYPDPGDLNGWMLVDNLLAIWDNPVEDIVVLNSNADGPGSLAAAINTANTRSGMNWITFAPTVTDPIILTSALPALADPTGGTVIDGYSAPNGSHSIVLDGSLLSGTEHGLMLGSDGNEVSGLTIIGFPGAGILIQGASNSIDDCYIGVASDGTTAAGNDWGIHGEGASNRIGEGRRNVISGNHRWGVTGYGPNLVLANNFIGTDVSGMIAVPNNAWLSPGLRAPAVYILSGDDAIVSNNLISGNNTDVTWEGLRLQESNHPIVQNNKIGTDVTGNAALPNYFDGLSLLNCTAPEVLNNLISGNGGAGIRVSGCLDAVIRGNKVGTDIDGWTAIANGANGGWQGIGIVNSQGTVIGGELSTECNIISGNTASGVTIEDIPLAAEQLPIATPRLLVDSIGALQATVGSGIWEFTPDIVPHGDEEPGNSRVSSQAVHSLQMQYNHILNNYIGVGSNGITPIPNLRGIRIINVSICVIGDLLGYVGNGNLIANNSAYGILLEGCTEVIVAANVIKQSDTGVFLHSGASECLVNNNTIVQNQVNVALHGAATLHNNLLDNVIYGCTQGPDIDLWPSGITDPGEWTEDSPQESLNYPFIYINPVTGCAITAGPPNGVVHLYVARDASTDEDACFVDEQGNSHGGALRLMASTSCDPYGTCDIICDLDPSDLEPGDIITALGKDAAQNTSEFARNFVIEPMAIEGLCPIELEVEDPNGLVVNSSVNEIAGAVYDDLTDVNNDGSPDHRVLLPGRVVGQYRVRIQPAPDAEPSDVYSLRIVCGNDTSRLINNHPVPLFGEVDSLDFASVIPSGCCEDRVGNANGLGTYPNEVTISDIQTMVTAKFIQGTCTGYIECLAEGDVNQSGGADPTCPDITISDIQTLVNHLFIAGPANAPLKDCL